MKTKYDTESPIKRKILILTLVVLSVLLIPLIAVNFSVHVNWGYSDFIIAGVLLYGFWLVVELVPRKAKNNKHKILLGAVVIMIFLLIWAELAVGIFD